MTVMRAHDLQNLGQIVSPSAFFKLSDIFRQCQPVFPAIGGDFRKAGMRVALFTRRSRSSVNFDRPASDAPDPHETGLSRPAKGLQIHRVRMRQRKRCRRDHFDLRSVPAERLRQHPVGSVSHSGQCQRSVQPNRKPVRLRMLRQKQLCGFFRTHGVRAGGSLSDQIQFRDGFHAVFLFFIR